MAESRGLRGSVLEEMINMTNTVYRDKNLALIQNIALVKRKMADSDNTDYNR